MLDLGLVSAILGEVAFEEVIAFAGNHRFKCVEVMCWPNTSGDKRRYAGITHIDTDTIDDQIPHIQEVLSKHKVYISGLGYYPNPLDPDVNNAQIYIAHIKKVIKTASKMGIPVVNTFIGRDPAKTTEYNLDRYAEV